MIADLDSPVGARFAADQRPDRAPGPTAGPDRRQLIGHFDRWAPDYDDSALQEAFYEPLHDQTLRLARQAVAGPARILDIGCGTARLFGKAAGVFPAAELVGVDLARRMLVQSRARGGRPHPIRLVQADVAHLPFADGTFDLAVSTASCHHWRDQAAAFAEVHRVLRPGGAFVLAHLLGVIGTDRDGSPGRRRRARRTGDRETARILARLSDAGFAAIRTTSQCASPVMPRTVVLSMLRPRQLPTSKASVAGGRGRR